MDTLGEINELFTTKMCSPVVIFGIVLLITCVSVYLSRSTLQRYNTQKMENLYSLYTMQEFKFMLILGVTMYGLCQYNKTELAWIFLIFPIIYVLIQNGLLFVHVSSALQNAPKSPSSTESVQYGMQPPLMEQKSSPPSNIAGPEQYVLPKVSNNSVQLSGTPMFSGGGGSNIGF